MSPFSIAILAFSMSADACAAAMARGVATKPSLSAAIKGGLVFGVVETLTPLVGWAFGLAASNYIASVDHWVAFALLCIVGSKMALEAIGRFGVADGDMEGGLAGGGTLTLILTAIATSIDAAAVGVTLALVSVNIVSVALAIGLTTFVLATAGMMIGRRFGAKFGPLVECPLSIHSSHSPKSEPVSLSNRGLRAGVAPSPIIG